MHRLLTASQIQTKTKLLKDGAFSLGDNPNYSELTREKEGQHQTADWQKWRLSTLYGIFS